MNHLSRNYKIKCFFPLLTLPFGAGLSGGGVREGCVVVHRVMSAAPPLLISDQSLGDSRTSGNPLVVLSSVTLQRVDSHSAAASWL